MLKYRKKILEISILFSILFLVCLMIFLPYLMNNSPFMGGYDVRNTYRLFFQEYRNLLSNSIFQRTLPFWSWNTFLGNNFWSSKTFYLIGDVYNYLFIFSKIHYYNILMYLTIIKIFVSAFGFYLYGKYRGWKFSTILVGSLFYAFAAWPFKYTEQPMFLSFYSWLPLYFLSIELSLKNKNKVLFVLMVFILTLTNYYLVYSLIIFSLIYFTYRYYQINYSIKGLIKEILLIIPFFLLGVCLTGFLLLPTLIFMSENNRILNTSFNWFLFSDLKVYLNLISNIFVPSSSYIGKVVQWNNETVFSSFYETGVYQTREIMAWAGSLTSLLVIYSIFDPDKKQAKLNRVFYLVMFLIVIFPIGNSIMHGFSEPSFRWLLFLTFMNLILSMHFLNQVETLNFKLFKNITYFVCLMLLTLLFVSVLFTGDSFVKYNRHIFIFLLFILLIFSSYKIIGDTKFRNYIIILVIFEISINSYLSFYDNQVKSNFTWDFIKSSETVLGKDYNELRDYLSQFDSDSEYYRIYAPYDSIYWYMSLNMNMIYNFSDVKTYDSTYQPALDNLYKIHPEIYISPQMWNITKPELIDFLTIKYAVVTKIEELPHQNFTFIGKYRELLVYLNNNYRPIIQNGNDVISYNQITQPFTNTNQNLIISNSEDLNRIKGFLNEENIVTIENVNLYQNMLTGTIYSKKPTFLISSIAYDKGWRVYINDNEMETFAVNGGFLGFPSSIGEQNIKLYFVPIGFREGVILSVLSGLLFLIYFSYSFYKLLKNVTIKREQKYENNQ